MCNVWPLGGRQAVSGSQPTEEQALKICAFRETLLGSEEYQALTAEAHSYVADDR